MRFDMAHFISKEGVWDVLPDGQSDTPVLKVTGLRPGTFVKVTCNFCAQAAQEVNDEGFFYSVGTKAADDVMAMTPTTAAFQGDEGWQSCTLIAVFEVLSGTDGEVEFGCHFKNGAVTLMNFVMIAEIL
jgi:hypothetical protein